MQIFEATMIVEGAWDMVDGDVDEERFEAAAQVLIDTGVAWRLQGSIGRVCAALIDAGVCHRAEEVA